MQKKTSGFTLIELSIVLVIIGLVVGGVLVGRDLIKAAELRKQISQIESFDVAFNTFRLKYNCLPGDCANATNFGFAGNGNGNGEIGVTGVSLHTGLLMERAFFWTNLFEANLIGDGNRSIDAFTGDGCRTVDCSPPIKLKSIGTPTGGAVFFTPGILLASNNTIDYAFTRASTNHYYWLSQCSGDFFAGETTCGIYTPQTTFELDSKMDDGFPLTGKVVARGNASAGSPGGPADVVPGAGGAAANVCVSNSVTPNIYNAVNTSGNQASLCSLTINATF